MPLSRQAIRSLRDLRTESRAVQRSGGVGSVRSSRTITAALGLLEDDLRRLEGENAQFLMQVAGGRAENQRLQEEIITLRNELAECHGETE